MHILSKPRGFFFDIGVNLAKELKKRCIHIMSLIQILVCLNIDIGGAIVCIFKIKLF